jgi:hypothetical protein
MNNFLLSEEITSAFPNLLGNCSWVLGQCTAVGRVYGAQNFPLPADQGTNPQGNFYCTYKISIFRRTYSRRIWELGLISKGISSKFCKILNWHAETSLLINFVGGLADKRGRNWIFYCFIFYLCVQHILAKLREQIW